MHNPWEHSRSLFNHGWLKNQLVAVLLKCRQVQMGVVFSDSARQDLNARLSQWSDARKAADAVVAEVEAALERDFRNDEIDAPVDTRVVRLANEVERVRWIDAEDPSRAAAAARAAIDELDSKIIRALQVMAPAAESASIGIDDETLGGLINAAQRLSEAFSQLTLHRSISEPA
jgi:hypothetical protein